jgi:anti-sigma regulatory factor (Ser/Thr protein kinase)
LSSHIFNNLWIAGLEISVFSLPRLPAEKLGRAREIERLPHRSREGKMMALFQRAKLNNGEEGTAGVRRGEPLGPTPRPTVRIAIYDSLASIPRVEELSDEGCQQFIGRLAAKAHEFSQAKGGEIPYTVIREIVENLIHAYFAEAIITILDNGNTIRISDQGPGIRDKERAFSPGFSTATQEMKQIIRGVGSGLPVAREMLKVAGGTITVEDNLERGAVITLALAPAKKKGELKPQQEEPAPLELSDRQKKVLFLVTELGPVGPSKVAQELNISLSSAYRDFLFLERNGLVKTNSRGKRELSPEGVDCLEKIFK